MNKVKISTQKILEELSRRFPDTTEFKTSAIKDVGDSLGYKKSDWIVLCNAKHRVRIGYYELAHLVKPIREAEIIPLPTAAVAMAPQSIVNKEKTFATIDPTYVAWGAHSDIKKVIKSEMFYPVYVAGMSGNGKNIYDRAGGRAAQSRIH